MESKLIPDLEDNMKKGMWIPIGLYGYAFTIYKSNFSLIALIISCILASILLVIKEDINRKLKGSKHKKLSDKLKEWKIKPTFFKAIIILLTFLNVIIGFIYSIILLKRSITQDINVNFGFILSFSILLGIFILYKIFELLFNKEEIIKTKTF